MGLRFERRTFAERNTVQVSDGRHERGRGHDERLPIERRTTIADRAYIYRWNRCGKKGQRCRVTARGTLNSCRVEFEDGFVMITSRNALRRERT